MPSFLAQVKELETKRPHQDFTPLEPRAEARRRAREAKKVLKANQIKTKKMPETDQKLF